MAQTMDEVERALLALQRGVPVAQLPARHGNAAIAKAARVGSGLRRDRATAAVALADELATCSIEDGGGYRVSHVGVLRSAYGAEDAPTRTTLRS